MSWVVYLVNKMTEAALVKTVKTFVDRFSVLVLAYHQLTVLKDNRGAARIRLDLHEILDETLDRVGK